MRIFRLLVLAAVLLPEAAWSQRARLDECIKPLTADSVALYYDRAYLLTPVACATTRRLARLDSTGVFHGWVTDFRTSDNTRSARLHYRGGVLDGPLTLYHPNGQLAAQGQLQQGKRVGEWQYWYADGRPRQVLRFPLNDQMRILASWDTLGGAQVVNGTGHWAGLDQEGNRYGGPIRFGVPDGRWESRSPVDDHLVRAAQFDRGKPRRVPNPPQTVVYSLTPPPRPDFAKLLPRAEEAFDQTSGLVLGDACDERLRKARFHAIADYLRLPTFAGGPNRYGELVAQRMIRYGTPRWFEVLPPYTTVRCALDTTGRFVDFISTEPALREVVKTVVQKLPRWQPATFKGRAVPSYVDITLNKATRRVRIKPAARLRYEDVMGTAATSTP